MTDTDTYEVPESVEGEDTWLSIGEASSALGLSVETLRRYDATGRFRAGMRSPGGQRRYRRSQIDQALASWAADTAPVAAAR